MTKIGVMIVLAVLLIGSAIYFAGTKVNPAVTTKGDKMNTTLSGVTVGAADGKVTATAP